MVSEEALDAVIDRFEGSSGIRGLEQAAEHIAANALYQIEAEGKSNIVFDAEMIRALLG